MKKEEKRLNMWEFSKLNDIVMKEIKFLNKLQEKEHRDRTEAEIWLIQSIANKIAVLRKEEAI